MDTLPPIDFGVFLLQATPYFAVPLFVAWLFLQDEMDWKGISQAIGYFACTAMILAVLGALLFVPVVVFSTGLRPWI